MICSPVQRRGQSVAQGPHREARRLAEARRIQFPSHRHRIGVGAGEEVLGVEIGGSQV